MTVMFKKEMVLKAGNYEDGLYMEDDLLWLNMISAGARTGNVDQILCKVRVGSGDVLNAVVVFAISNSIAKHAKECTRVTDFLWRISEKCFIQVVVALCPGFVRQFIFLKLLRKSK